ncbi:Lichenan permease IIC component [Streptococcus parauberis]|uniref:Permease IIC component n=1 Tax=Streptococcus parauberis KRS-02083 TaxID=1207545 RepID=A0ABN0IT09_9STRE|nr:PTS transporter subunit EIIC [Streptococcus parauberis]AUT06038.1 Lichenan permease IIC component [Streptococcus parauberis]EMG25916.1 PTS system cellobiose-specific IIC protein [Streptococcus parauberis KRS-02083]UWV09445.1 PTS transporter subunit EIIC [Streptococcus parauberis]WEM62213.1 PTS transporter subunit EIIC [Streptococcus parauberis]WEM66081.1 PTS transporter subunit EIIC [Streptococcus parauberis]
MEESKWGNFLEKFAEFSARLGNQIHLRTLRDAFTTIMPLFILAGLAVLLNNVVFTALFNGDVLAKFQTYGNMLTNGSLNIAGLLITPVIAYFLSQHRDFDKPISSSVVAISSLFVMLPIIKEVIPNGAEKAIEVSGLVTFKEIGTTGLFAGIIIGMLATEMFIKLTKNKHLRIRLGDDVPPAVGESFSTMIPLMLTVSFFALISALLLNLFNTDMVTLITNLVQEPLRRVNTSLFGYLLIYSTGNFLFTLGIHQSVINATLTEPLMLLNMNENMAAVQAGKEAPHILNSAFQTCYAQMGGTGGTFALVILVMLFIKYKPFKDIIKLSVGPGLFEINEPIIFGFPIVFNLPMMIPFVLSPVIGALIGYFATVVGFVKPLTVMVPWTTPPLISGFLASQGDIKVVLVQIIILIVTALFYWPFVIVAQKAVKKQAEIEGIVEEI